MASSGPKIREHDADGRLLFAGYTWQEPRYWVYRWFGTIGFFAFLIFTTVYSSMPMDVPGAMQRWDQAKLIGALAAACAAVCIFLGQKRRRVLFGREGHILTPRGMPDYFRMRCLHRHHEQITSIEVNDDDEGCGVIIYTSEGEGFVLTKGLTHGYARLAAVQLTNALREIRESVRTVETFSAPQSMVNEWAWID